MAVFQSHRIHTLRRSIAPGFSIVELLVVISIIVVLVAVLLVALGKAQESGRRTKTMATLTAFRTACEEFQLQFGRYPGVIPESVMAQTAACPISTTENALLNLMGGYRLQTPHSNQKEIDEYTNYDGVEFTFGSGNSEYLLKFNINDFGQGPYIDGKPYAPFLAVDDKSVRDMEGVQVDEDESNPIPDLIDAWGQPIIYVRQLRKNGPLVGDTADDPKPQFSLAGTRAYLASTQLGELGLDQNYGGGNDRGSILTVTGSAGGSGIPVSLANFAQIIRNPGIGDSATPDNIMDGAARGAFGLISAGPDGVYFSAADGPGAAATGMQVTDLTASPHNTAKVVEEYDDVLLFGGG
jgi:type II secretory pathway pseudopilin PulG